MNMVEFLHLLPGGWIEVRCAKCREVVKEQWNCVLWGDIVIWIDTCAPCALEKQAESGKHWYY
jgi:hypothetical protein